MGLRGVKPRHPSQRFHDKYQVDPESGCWEWTAHRSPEGYGTIGWTREPGDTVSVYAHRLSYEMHHGPIPAGLVVDHMCNNRGCVNPDHLQAITHRANCLRSTSPATRRYWLGVCIRGHDMTDPANVYIRKDTGRRQCRACMRIRALERNRRNGIKPRPGPSPCGTYPAAIAHYRRGEKPCEPCLAAAAAYQRDQKMKRRRGSTTGDD